MSRMFVNNISKVDEPLMSNATRTRIFAVAVVLIVIPIGLFARSHRAGADGSTWDGFLATYTGDTLWPIMFYFMGRFVWPTASCTVLFAGTVVLTLAIEFGQLWQPDWLQWLRAQPVIGFLLGNSFIWSDVVCCLIGAGIAVGLDLVPTELHRRWQA